MQGVEETLFAPDAALTRGQAVTILYRLAGTPAVSSRNPFRDVAAGSYCEDAVIWANAKGIAQGYDAVTFRPGRGHQSPAVRRPALPLCQDLRPGLPGQLVLPAGLSRCRPGGILCRRGHALVRHEGRDPGHGGQAPCAGGHCDPGPGRCHAAAFFPGPEGLNSRGIAPIPLQKRRGRHAACPGDDFPPLRGTGSGAIITGNSSLAGEGGLKWGSI